MFTKNIILFSNEDAKISFQNKNKITNIIKMIAKDNSKDPENINYIFCNEDYLYKIHVLYLNHHTLSDIITFDYSHDNIISGDIYISVDGLKCNSKKFKTIF